ncbi:MAG TPA: 4Fe-4S dicluster domain-containing protein [Gammaproteobacteria bacterium]|nr:4Fe-4S dicluster domain-containing protein [Gammaproteobacteria bacterium]
MKASLTLFLYLLPMLLIFTWYTKRKQQQHRNSLVTLEENRKSGLLEPSSLHPLIDITRCMGCGSCVSACPEGNVLGVIDGKAHLVNPTHCIGHSACKTACPFDAITLVFGTENRGMDIPVIKPNFETTMDGIFIAGELGGMGLIRNAVEQGRQALEHICKHPGIGNPGDDRLDLLIVGAGPAGFTASLGAMQHGLKSVTIEQETLGGTVSHFPRGKLVMTAPVKLPVVGKMPFTETTKETLLEFWENVEKKTGLKIRYQERLEEVVAENDGYQVTTSKGSYRTRTLLLAIGRRGTPRKLGVPGEALSKVVYRLIDAEQYQGQQVLVVGGGDSALEAATSIAEQPGTDVTISYRSGAFSRAKEKNRQKVAQAEQEGRLRVLFTSNVTEISERQVILEQEGNTITLDNDAVIISAGGILPTPFLKKIGVQVETRHGTA